LQCNYLVCPFAFDKVEVAIVSFGIIWGIPELRNRFFEPSAFKNAGEGAVTV